MKKLEKIEIMIEQLSNELIQKQQPDGKWNFCFESGVMTDAYMLLLIQVLGKRTDQIKQLLINRILSKQTSYGTWKTFPDEKKGNPSATMEACLALLYSNTISIDDERLQKAKTYLWEQGQVEKANPLTKTVFAMFGHYPWSNLSQIPIEFLLLPTWGPIHFYDFVGYARVHLAPIMLIHDKQMILSLPNQKNIKKWFPEIPIKKKKTTQLIKQQIAPYLPNLFKHDLHQKATHLGTHFLFQRIEPDGTLYNYMSSTFLFIIALLALGYPKDHPAIEKAYLGLVKEYFYVLSQVGHIQEANSNVWDTGLVLYALSEAGIHPNNRVMAKGQSYLLTRQHTRSGDWVLRNRGIRPGGWGFSDKNTIHPDIDDTTIALRVLTPSYAHTSIKKAWDRGATWLLSMQNKDGGWPAFEKDTGKLWQSFLPDLGSKVWGDPSMADLTGRSLEFIGNFTSYRSDDKAIIRACDWLLKNQCEDGSWFGRWGVTYIYGTWAAITGLAAIGLTKEHSSIKKAIKWLLSIQQADGGWGESCYSDQKRKYCKLDFSTPVQTAWALDALIAVHDSPTVEIQAGIDRLLHLLKHRGHEWRYPVGSGLAGEFYVYYHSYPYVWPLIALCHYYKKYRLIECNI